jgi:hypothetical protein
MAEVIEGTLKTRGGKDVMHLFPDTHFPVPHPHISPGA